MKVIFYLHCSGKCGGIRVVCEYVSRLNDAGIDCELWTPPCAKFSWYPRPLRHRMFSSLDELGRVARETRAHKVATWWETAFWVQQTLRNDDKGFYLTQDIETTYSSNPMEDARVLSTYRMGLTPLCTSKWVMEELSWNHECRSDVAPIHVGLGIDLETFQPLPMAREQYRIFTPYRPQAGPRDLKGWLCARAAADHCRNLEPKTSMVTFSLWHGPNDVPAGLPHIHVTNANDLKLRELYAQAGVFLMASNHEGFGLTALEAMATGTPTVMTRCNGNEEYTTENVNCLTAPPGHSSQLGEHCANIMQDMALAHRLGAAGIETAREYDWKHAVKRMKDALTN